MIRFQVSFLRFCLLTGQRREETAALRWFDVAGDIWTIPEEINKTGTTQSVPLAALSLDIIRDQLKRAGSPYIFATRTGGIISNHSRRIIRQKASGVPNRQ